MLLCSLSPGVRINCVDIWVRNCVDPPRLLTCQVTGARFTQFLTHVLCLRQEQVHSQNGQSRRSPFHNNIPTPRRPPLHLSFLSCRHKNRLVIITHKHTPTQLLMISETEMGSDSLFVFISWSRQKRAPNSHAEVAKDTGGSQLDFSQKFLEYRLGRG